MLPAVRKTPSYLKGLAETRARAAGDVLRYQALLDTVAAKLAEAKSALEACDCLIRRYDERLDPTRIPPVRAQKGRYGAHGALRNAILEELQRAAPRDITTTELCLTLETHFGLDFLSGEERTYWQANSLRRELKRLTDRGLVERLHDPLALTGEAGRWRLKSDDAPSLDHLQARAEASGAAVLRCDDDPA